jgi:hypothetical protein
MGVGAPVGAASRVKSTDRALIHGKRHVVHLDLRGKNFLRMSPEPQAFRSAHLAHATSDALSDVSDIWILAGRPKFSHNSQRQPEMIPIIDERDKTVL